ncbi:MAG TPA: DNA-binding protein [Woeseiaceae bacterium]|nr:DNA-binding protein [Woeseiaceae bacterium]
MKIGQLVEHDTDSAQVGRMLEAVRQNIADARSDAVSAETRFEAAYRAITQCAIVALWANGYCPSQSSPGHHVTLIQSLPASIGLDVDQMRLLDTFCVKRNVIDYSSSLRRSATA